MNKLSIFIFLVFLIISCKSDQKSGEALDSYDPNLSYDSDDSGSNYNDGEYCATIEYYNAETSNSSTYTLNVHVENGKLMQIDWPNGGWLDDTHFDPPDVDDDGTCSFSTYEGKNYEIQIDGDENCLGSISSPESDDEDYNRNVELLKHQQILEDAVREAEESDQEEQRQQEEEEEQRREEEKQQQESEDELRIAFSVLPGKRKQQTVST